MILMTPIPSKYIAFKSTENQGAMAFQSGESVIHIRLLGGGIFELVSLNRNKGKECFLFIGFIIFICANVVPNLKRIWRRISKARDSANTIG